MSREHFPGRRLKSRMFREVVGAPINFKFRDVEYRAEKGDWIDAEVFRELTMPVRRRLGRTVSMNGMARLTKYLPPDNQFVVRPLAFNARPIERPIEQEAQTPNREEAFEAYFSDSGVLIWDPEVELPLGPEETERLMAAAAKQGNVAICFAASNLQAPASLPIIGDQGASYYQRLPGGTTPLELAARLAHSDLKPSQARPAYPCCAWVKMSVWDAPGRPVRAEATVTTPTAWVYRKADRSGPVAALFGIRPDAADWAQTAHLAHNAAQRAVLRRPPVALYSTSVGPWGGVGVLFQLADELQELGAHAFVLHSGEVGHHYTPRTSPLKVRVLNSLARRWPDIIGKEAMLVASHWGCGHRIAEVKSRNPDVVVTSILQDREDLFENNDGANEGTWGPYLAIEKGRAVAQWIVDSMGSDLGQKIEDYGVIPAGIDTNIFSPHAGERSPLNPGPVRVLAMWRPQTAQRRGIALLRNVYDLLHARYRRGVSLELFGWNEGSGEGRAPTYTTHHGTLTPREVAKIMAEVHIVIEPSLFQGYGLPGAECMACGALLISTQCRGVDEYATHGLNAWVVPHDLLGESVAAAVNILTGEDEDDRAELLQVAARGPEAVAETAWPIVGAKWAVYLAELYREEHPAGEWILEWAAIKARAEERLAEFYKNR